MSITPARVVNSRKGHGPNLAKEVRAFLFTQTKGNTMAEADGLTGVQPALPATPADGTQPGTPAVPSQDLSRYQPEPATDPNTPPAQGSPQGQPTPDLTPQEKHWQSLAGQRYAQMMQVQAERDLLRQQLDQVQRSQQPQTPQNPYDIQQDYVNWSRWENNQLLEANTQRVQQVFMSNIQNAMKQQQEFSWQSAHPEVDINAVKAFATQRQIGNLDDALLLMNYNQNMGQVAQNTTQQAFTQFKQPQVGATPVRGSTTQTSQTMLSFEKLTRELAANPSALDNLPADLQKAYWQEFNARNGR